LQESRIKNAKCPYFINQDGSIGSCKCSLVCSYFVKFVTHDSPITIPRKYSTFPLRQPVPKPMLRYQIRSTRQSEFPLPNLFYNLRVRFLPSDSRHHLVNPNNFYHLLAALQATSVLPVIIRLLPLS
jgi:hypothetical protein